MKTKTITYILMLLVVVSASLSACSKYLDKEPDTELTMDMIFENKDKVEGMLGYIYEGLPNPTGAWMMHEGWHFFADDLVINRSVNWGPWSELEKWYGSWTASTSWGGNYWANYPKRIRQSNLFQSRIHPIEGISLNEVNIMKLEARFLSAYYWWHLTETYGPVPFKPDYMFPQDAAVEELLLPRTPFDEIVDYLDNELLTISKSLPAKYSNPEKYGRATSIMALTLRARMLLFAASPIANGNPWYADFKNNDGTALFKAGYDPHKWEKAAEACKLVVEEAEKAGHTLFTIYNNDGTVDPFLSTSEIYFTQASAGNKEITFPMTNVNGYNSEHYVNLAVATEFGGAGTMGVYQGLVDAYFMDNGLPAIKGYNGDGSPIINSVSGYSETGFSTHIQQSTTSWDQGTGTVGEVSPAGTYNMYANREPRFYTTVTYHGSWCVMGNRKYDFMYMHQDNNHQWNAPRNCYLIRRKVHSSESFRDGILYRDRPEWLYRLATSYLDYAEAVNEAYDNRSSRQESLNYLNKIRIRAGIRQYTFDAVAPTDELYIQVQDSKESVRELVHMERRVELAAEGIRAFDVRRWLIAEEIPEMNGPLVGLNWNSSEPASFFQRTKNLDQSRVWKKAYYWMPIHVDEIDKNPNLVQAPFWN